jgi:class 3 adenylate cyclase
VTFEELLQQAIAMLQRQGRVSYRAFKRQFALDDDYFADLKEAMPYAYPQVVDEAGRGLVWLSEAPTVMFCDLVDSTQLAWQLDLEDWREVIRAYQQTGQEAKVLLDVLRTT